MPIVAVTNLYTFMLSNFNDNYTIELIVGVKGAETQTGDVLYEYLKLSEQQKSKIQEKPYMYKTFGFVIRHLLPPNVVGLFVSSAYKWEISALIISKFTQPEKVRTSNSDILVTIKRNDKVVRHAYIRSNSSYTFEMPNGTYQPFFYYGKGWNPEKVMKQTTEGTVKGGFIEEEDFGKDYLRTLNNNILERLC